MTLLQFPVYSATFSTKEAKFLFKFNQWKHGMLTLHFQQSIYLSKLLIAEAMSKWPFLSFNT